jgi:hypothetical protein
MNTQCKFTAHELKVIDYLAPRSNVYWEELAQFAKDPQSVKLKTIKKTVSEIKRKCTEAGSPIPFNVVFFSMLDKQEEKPVEETFADENIFITPDNDGTIPVSPELTKTQNLVKLIRSTPVVPSVPAVSNQTTTTPTSEPAVLSEFRIDRNYKSVRTKYGNHLLNDREWDVFKYFYANVGRVIPQSELKEKVTFAQWGSKTPARWFNIIGGIIGRLRRQVPGLNNHLLTVKGVVETGYLFQ